MIFVTLVLTNATVADDGFVLSPVSLNVTLSTVAMFQCQHPNSHGINWKINGNILKDFPHGIGAYRIGSVYTLSITALPDYNQTVIECVALFANSPSEMSSAAVMMVQGKYSITYHHVKRVSHCKKLHNMDFLN